MRQRRQLTIAILAAGLLLAGAAWFLIPSPHGPRYTPVNIKEMGDFQFDPTGGTLADVPPGLRQLDGRKVVIEGEPITTGHPADGDDLHFELVYSRQDSHGRAPFVQQRVFAHMSPARLPLDFGQRYVEAYGTLHVKLDREPDGATVTRLYSLDVDRLEDTDGSSSGAESILSVWPLLSPWARGMMLTILLALIGWTVGMIWYRRQRAARRDPAAMPCPVCGYDARGNTTSRCPECNALLGRW